MSFVVTPLKREEFAPLFDLSAAELAERGVIRKTADAKPGYPCRVSLKDAEPGEQVLLLNHESHKAPTPFRSSYAIYVRENAQTARDYVDEIPPVMRDRPIALRLFNADAMLIGADIDLSGDASAKIESAFANPDVAYIHAHNAMHGCFSAEIKRAP